MQGEGIAAMAKMTRTTRTTGISFSWRHRSADFPASFAKPKVSVVVLFLPDNDPLGDHGVRAKQAEALPLSWPRRFDGPFALIDGLYDARSGGCGGQGGSQGP